MSTGRCASGCAQCATSGANNPPTRGLPAGRCAPGPRPQGGIGGAPCAPARGAPSGPRTTRTMEAHVVAHARRASARGSAVHAAQAPGVGGLRRARGAPAQGALGAGPVALRGVGQERVDGAEHGAAGGAGGAAHRGEHRRGGARDRRGVVAQGAGRRAGGPRVRALSRAVPRRRAGARDGRGVRGVAVLGARGPGARAPTRAAAGRGGRMAPPSAARRRAARGARAWRARRSAASGQRPRAGAADARERRTVVRGLGGVGRGRRRGAGRSEAAARRGGAVAIRGRARAAGVLRGAQAGAGRGAWRRGARRLPVAHTGGPGWGGEDGARRRAGPCRARAIRLVGQGRARAAGGHQGSGGRGAPHMRAARPPAACTAASEGGPRGGAADTAVAGGARQPRTDPGRGRDRRRPPRRLSDAHRGRHQPQAVAGPVGARATRRATARGPAGPHPRRCPRPRAGRPAVSRLRPTGGAGVHAGRRGPSLDPWAVPPARRTPARHRAGRAAGAVPVTGADIARRAGQPRSADGWTRRRPAATAHAAGCHRLELPPAVAGGTPTVPSARRVRRGVHGRTSRRRRPRRGSAGAHRNAGRAPVGVCRARARPRRALADAGTHPYLRLGASAGRGRGGRGGAGPRGCPSELRGASGGTTARPRRGGRAAGPGGRARRPSSCAATHAAHRRPRRMRCGCATSCGDSGWSAAICARAGGGWSAR